MATLAGALYYSMAAERTRRGNAPEADAQQHAAHTPPTRAELDALFEYAPLALWFVYEETLVDMQRHASNHGFALLFGSTQSDVGKPAFAVFARKGGAVEGRKEHSQEATEGAQPAGRHTPSAAGAAGAGGGGGGGRAGEEEHRSSPHGTHDGGAPDPADATLDADDEGGGYAGVAVLVVRGTNDLTDAIMDARAEGIPFRTEPPPHEQASRRRRGGGGGGEGGRASSHGTAENGTMEGEEEEEEDAKEEEEEVEVDGDAESGGTPSDGFGGFAHSGVLEAAQWLLAEVLLPLHQLHASGYRVVLCGHSLGAGVASVLTVLLRPLLPGVTCVGFATPPVLAGEPLLRQSTSFVTSVILRRDCIPRATIQSGRRMLSQLASFDSSWDWRR